MNGRETKDELERCSLWDLIFVKGPMSLTRLKMVASDQDLNYTAARIKSLTNHSWFLLDGGEVSIAFT